MNTIQDFFIFCRCFEDVINLLLEITLESTERDTSALQTTLSTVLSEAMASGTLRDPAGTARDLSVNSTAIRSQDIAVGSGKLFFVCRSA